jgi:hypothetical protein
MIKCKICGTKYREGLTCHHEPVLAGNLPQANNEDIDKEYWRKLALRLQGIGVDLLEKLGDQGVEVMKVR